MSKHLIQWPMLKHLSQCSFLNKTRQVSHPYTTVHKTVVAYILIVIFYVAKEVTNDSEPNDKFSGNINSVVKCISQYS
jgi:hypothetical protein